MVALLFVVFLGLLTLGTEVGFTMIVAAWLGISTKSDRVVDAVLLPTSMMSAISYYALVQIPLFILAGEIMNQGGLTRRIYRLADALVGSLPGGLGTMEIRAMTDKGYDRHFAASITAASSLIGPIILPSVPMVIYGAITGASVGALFLAGVVPGILMALSLMVAVFIYALRGHCP